MRPKKKSGFLRLTRGARARAGVQLVLLATFQVAGLGCRESPDLRGVSVLLVSPDSLRADGLAIYSDAAQAETPHLDALAASGTTFLETWATAPWTAPAMVSVMTGHHPPAHGVVYRDDTTPTDLPSLPRVLGERGYAVGNFTFFSALSYFRNLGLGPTVPGANHRNLPSSFENWLGDLQPDQPFFAWVHLLETHLPYGATGYRAAAPQVEGSEGLEATQTQATVPIGSVQFEPGDEERIRDLYDRDIEAMDVQLGGLLEALERSGRRERTLIVFVADHGEELFDDASSPWVGHASTAAEARLLPSTLKIPFVLAGPGVPAGLRVDDLVQPVDLMATLASWFRAPEMAGGGVALPEIEPSGWRARRREVATFDSSPGGNLTPAERRGDRVQGITDGECLLVEHVETAFSGSAAHQTLENVSAPDRPKAEIETETRIEAVGSPSVDCAERRTALRRELDSWRRDQTAARLALLRGAEDPPESKVADGWAEGLAWSSPTTETLEHRATGGQITLDWAGGADSAWVQYRLLGRGARLVGGVDGAFRVEQRPVTFGPIPEGFWNDVASYSPVEVRVLDPETESRTPWRRFDVEAVAPND